MNANKQLNKQNADTGITEGMLAEKEGEKKIIFKHVQLRHIHQDYWVSRAEEGLYWRNCRTG